MMIAFLIIDRCEELGLVLIVRPYNSEGQCPDSPARNPHVDLCVQFHLVLDGFECF